MADICKTEGIVLRGMRFLESSRIVSLYTKNFGKVKVIAKGVRRPRSRFGSALEPFTVSNIVFYRRERKELYTVSEADIVTEHALLREDLGRIGTAAVIIDFLDAANPEESQNLRLYALAISMLDVVEESPYRLLDLPLWTFLLRAAGILGYAPVLEHCVECKRKRTIVGLSPSLGGVVCADCSRGKNDVWRISQRSLEVLEKLAREGEKDFSGEKTSPGETEEITEILRAHMLYHTERRMKSFDFKKSLRSEGFPPHL
jgi:DNA repair protein RecO (recombination protein O)